MNYFQKKRDPFSKKRKRKKERKKEKRKDGKLDYSFKKLRRETFATKRIEQIYKFQEISGKGEVQNFPVKFHRSRFFPKIQIIPRILEKILLSYIILSFSQKYPPDPPYKSV